MNIDLSAFLKQILSMQLTLNEFSVLLELGYRDFSREDLLNNSNRVFPGTYSASALTRTLQKLSIKNPPLISASPNSDGKTIYRLVDGSVAYGSYEYIIQSIAHSKLMTLNTMRVAIQLILNDNKPSTARYLAKQLQLDPDYLASTVLPRMIVIGLIMTTPMSSLENINNTDKDISTALSAVNLNLKWNGEPNVILL